MDQGLTATIRDAMPLAAHLGFEGVEGGAEAVVVRGVWAPEHCTAAGVLHGGVLMSLADAAGGVCAFLNLPAGAAGTATIESKTNFLGAVREGLVVARARPLHIGKTTIVVETDVFDAADRRVARTIQTQAVLAAD